jgi:hypothetical protein
MGRGLGTGLIPGGRAFPVGRDVGRDRAAGRNYAAAMADGKKRGGPRGDARGASARSGTRQGPQSAAGSAKSPGKGAAKGAGKGAGGRSAPGKGAGAKGAAADGVDERAAQLAAPLKRVLQRLPETQRRVLELRMGLVDGHPQDPADAARTLGISLGELREIEARAFERIREVIPLQQLQRFLER